MKRSNFLKSVLALPFIASNLSFIKKPKQELTFFTEEMLKKNNYGLFIIKSLVKDVKERPSYAATVSYKLGYQFGNEGYYTMSNFLTDGFSFYIGNTYEDVLYFLNNNPHGTKFRLMSKEEVLYLISTRNQGFI